MLAANQRFGEYVLLDRIGAGAFGEVWRARHNAWTDQVVAIKVPTDPQYVRNLQKEGAAIRGLVHPNIVQAIAFDPFAAEPYLVMEYVPGMNLRNLVQRGPLRVEVAVTILKQVLAALHHAHRGGMVHRDIKPENILIHSRALSPSPKWKAAVKLTDFGLGATIAPSRQSMIFSGEMGDGRTIAGSHQYMAPEQMEGEALDARADLYGCGIVLFEMLTGKRPAGTEVPSDLNPKVSPQLNEVYRRAVARRERRFASAQDFLVALSLAVDIPWPKTAAPQAWPPRLTEKQELFLAGVLAVVVIGATIIWWLWPKHAPNPVRPPLAVAPVPAIVAPQVTLRPAQKILATRPAAAIVSATSPPVATAPRPRFVTSESSAAVLPPPVVAAAPRPRVVTAASEAAVFPPPAPATRPEDEPDPVAVVNSTNAGEARDIVHSLSKHYPEVLKDVKELELLKYHDATDMRRHAGGPMDLPKTYASAAVGGTNNFIMLWGIYERWPAGKYLVVYRVQSFSELSGDNVCFLDVCRTGNTIAQRRPAAVEIDKGRWREIPVVMNLNEETEVEYRLWPHGHEMALDRVYIFRLRGE